ncbi:MAG TPA: hypothetical protein VHX13_04425 [Acidobacteriaceae bacterium]|jgi:hypothetical protein|nr:hypothetical protein [Acidobacteriaceae bacterium]
MNPFGRKSSRAEDRFEAWITEKHREGVLSGETVPTGQCPDEAFLRGVARRSKKILLSDPRIDHAANCGNCMNHILAIRQNIRSERKKLALGLAAACLVVVVGLVAWFRYENHHRQMVAINAPVSKIVDLWNTGTYRGEQPGQLQSVILPAAPVRLTIVLPRFSSHGEYLVAVTRDQSGNGVVVEGFASASASNGQEKVSVVLDLRSAKAGAYFLSTTHEQDQAAYYYPLQIKDRASK